MILGRIFFFISFSPWLSLSKFDDTLYCDMDVLLVLLLVALSAVCTSLSNVEKEPISESLFQNPLTDNNGEQVTREMKSSTLLEPIIIHHKGGQKDNKRTTGDGLCQGACITPRACDYHGGVPKGHCLSGSICCQFERSCGGISREKISFFRSPNYPNPLNDSLDCTYEVYPNDETCALKIEFLDFKIAKSTRFSKVEKCITDALYLLNTKDGSNEPLCDMENHTAIVYVKEKSSKPVHFLVIAQSEQFKWNLKITQINCKKLKLWENEPKCGRQLMYEPGSSGNDYESSGEGTNELQVNSYIVNGKDAESREFPWQISLQTTKGTHRCGGSILNDRYILTAAHCVMRNGYESKTKLKVIVGGYSLNGTDEGEDEEIEIESIIAHYHYKPEKSHLNDISIIKLAQKVKYSSSIQPICLPPLGYVTDGQDAWVSGWGRLNGTDPKAKANVLQKLKVKLLGDEECRKLVKKEIEEILHRNVTSTEVSHMARLGRSKSQLCARAKLNSAVCFGDSGGPLVIQREEDGSFMQVGVVSYGLGRCITERNPPAAYTRVSEFLHFIAIATSDQ